MKWVGFRTLGIDYLPWLKRTFADLHFIMNKEALHNLRIVLNTLQDIQGVETVDNSINLAFNTNQGVVVPHNSLQLFNINNSQCGECLSVSCFKN